MTRPQYILFISTLLLLSCDKPQNNVDKTTPAADAEQTVCIVRHAHSYKNVAPPPADRTGDQLDALTPQGEAQAEALHKALAAYTAPVIHSSPTGRTMATAATIAAGAPVVADERLVSLKGALDWEARRERAASGEDVRPEGGESLADGLARAAKVLEGERVKPLVVVTHGDIAALLLGELRGTPLLERPARHMLEAGGHECVRRPNKK